MSVQRLWASAHLVLVLLPFFVNSAETSWWLSRFDHLNDPFITADKAEELGLNKPGAEYLYSSGCNFTFPAGQPGLDEAYGASKKAIRAIGESIVLQRGKPHGDALFGIAAAIGDNIPPGGDALDSMFQTLRPLWGQEDGKGAPVEDFEQFKYTIKHCYAQTKQMRLGCIRKLERTITLNGWGASTGSLHVLPLAVTAAALYPVIAFDYLTELEAMRRPGYAIEASRIRNKARAIVREVKAEAIDAAVCDVFPQPLINDRAALGPSAKIMGFDVAARKYSILDARPPAITWFIGSPVKKCHQRAICVDERMELCKPASSTFDQTYQDARRGIAPTSFVGQIWAWLTGAADRRGKEVAIAKYKLSPYNLCTVEVRHPHNPQDDEMWARKSRRGFKNVQGLRVKLATFAITQALVENYYEQGAKWAMDNILHVADDLESTYTKLDSFLASSLKPVGTKS